MGRAFSANAERNPRTQTEPERGGSGRPPNNRKTALGYSGGDDFRRLRVYNSNGIFIGLMTQREAIALAQSVGSELKITGDKAEIVERVVAIAKAAAIEGNDTGARFLKVQDDRGNLVGMMTRQEALQLAYSCGATLKINGGNAEIKSLDLLTADQMNVVKHSLDYVLNQTAAEIRLFLADDEEKYKFKLGAVLKFLQGGQRVSLAMPLGADQIKFKFKGVEMMKRLISDLGDLATVREAPALRGACLFVEIEPKNRSRLPEGWDEATSEAYVKSMSEKLSWIAFEEKAEEKKEVTIIFKIATTGEASDMRIEKSSGAAAFDDINLRNLYFSSPFKPPPVDIWLRAVFTQTGYQIKLV